ncbi:unnamed protein product [Cochlearia groenlandica]
MVALCGVFEPSTRRDEGLTEDVPVPIKVKLIVYCSLFDTSVLVERQWQRKEFVLALSVKPAYGGDYEAFLQRVLIHSCSSNGTIRSWDTRSFHQVLCIGAENDQHVSSFSCGGAEDNLLADSCPHYYAAQYKEDLEVEIQDEVYGGAFHGEDSEVDGEDSEVDGEDSEVDDEEEELHLYGNLTEAKTWRERVLPEPTLWNTDGHHYGHEGSDDFDDDEENEQVDSDNSKEEGSH